MIELLALGLGLAIFGAYWLWRVFIGETVGTAKALMQGEHPIPGAPVTAVVKRHMDGNRPVDVELQLWTVGVPKVFRFEPGVALALSQALERAVGEVRASE